MLDTVFTVRGIKYVFQKQINLWGDKEIELYENGEIIGYLNVDKYSVEKAVKIIESNENFKEIDLLI
ncbi:hypothetical protein [Mammaliicoccus lentus]|uniref:hypothetical protein n=1 Tax=Mammaliicoccus lentus TaxID=42858 RepID=UPI00374FAB55